MGKGGQRYYGKSILTTTTDFELFDTLEADMPNQSPIVAKELTMISSSLFTFTLNGSDWVNDVYQDVDLRYKVSLTGVSLSSIVIAEDAVTIFIAILF